MPQAADDLDPAGETLLRLCRLETGWSLPELDHASYERLLRLAFEHGLLGALYPAASHGPTVPLSVLEACREAYQQQTAEAMMVTRQIREIVRACAAASIPVIPLKGGAAILDLYPDPSWRQVQDLDLLIPQESVAAVRRVMEKLEYAPRPNRSSKAEEELFLRGSHMRPYHREGRLPVEFHVSILQRQAPASVDAAVIDELWSHSVPAGAGLRRLSRPHAALHAGVHYTKDLRAGFSSLKGLMDLVWLAADATESGFWKPLWNAGGRWGVLKETSSVMATLRHELGVAVPGLPPDAKPFPRSWILEGLPGAAEAAEQRRRDGYGEMLRELAEAPDPAARLRLLIGLLLPAPEKLRLQYADERKPLAALYLHRLLAISGRLLKRPARPLPELPE